MKRFREYVTNLAKAGLSSTFVWQSYVTNQKKWKGVSSEQARFIVLETYHNMGLPN